MCAFCNADTNLSNYILAKTESFFVMCDPNPLMEGHILIIPHVHIKSVGHFSNDLFQEFELLYKKVSSFLKTEYGAVSSFEHGVIGQTIFHAHMHLLPFSGTPEEIIPEALHTEIKDMSDLRNKEEYLFFSIENKRYIVDTTLAEPRFFRNRFGRALGVLERSNWHEMQKDSTLVQIAYEEVERCKKLWRDTMI